MPLIKKNTKLNTNIDIKYQNLREVCLMIDNYLKETYIKLDKEKGKKLLDKYIFKGSLTRMINNIDNLVDYLKIEYGKIKNNDEWEIIYSFVSLDADNIQNGKNIEFSKLFYKACKDIKEMEDQPLSSILSQPF